MPLSFYVFIYTPPGEWGAPKKLIGVHEPGCGHQTRTLAYIAWLTHTQTRHDTQNPRRRHSLHSAVSIFQSPLHPLALSILHAPLSTLRCPHSTSQLHCPLSTTNSPRHTLFHSPLHCPLRSPHPTLHSTAHSVPLLSTPLSSPFSTLHSPCCALISIPHAPSHSPLHSSPPHSPHIPLCILHTPLANDSRALANALRPQRAGIWSTPGPLDPNLQRREPCCGVFGKMIMIPRKPRLCLMLCPYCTTQSARACECDALNYEPRPPPRKSSCQTGVGLHGVYWCLRSSEGVSECRQQTGNIRRLSRGCLWDPFRHPLKHEKVCE